MMRKQVSGQPKTRSRSAPAPSSAISVVCPSDAQRAGHSAFLPSAVTELTCQTSNGSGRSVRSADGRVRRCQSRTSGPSPSARQPLPRASASFRRCPSGGWSGRRTMAEVIAAGPRSIVPSPAPGHHVGAGGLVVTSRESSARPITFWVSHTRKSSGGEYRPSRFRPETHSRRWHWP